MSTLWLMVTLDKYELPLAVAESASELAKIAGVSKNTVMASVSHVKHGRKKRSKYIKVEVDD